MDRIRARRWLRTALTAAVPVGFVTALLFIPYVLLLVQSFWRLQGGAITHDFTLDNYRRLFGTALYPNTILFSAGIALRVTLFSLLLAYPLAYLLAFKVRRIRGRGALWAAEISISYDGGPWQCGCSILEFAGDKVAREIGRASCRERVFRVV